jgi:molybdopterin biosynthesis enzyme
MKQLADAVAGWLGDPETVKVVGAPGSPVSAAVAANLVIDPAAGSGTDHDAFVGERDHLRKAIDTLPTRGP